MTKGKTENDTSKSFWTQYMLNDSLINQIDNLSIERDKVESLAEAIPELKPEELREIHYYLSRYVASLDSYIRAMKEAKESYGTHQADDEDIPLTITDLAKRYNVTVQAFSGWLRRHLDVINRNQQLVTKERGYSWSISPKALPIIDKLRNYKK